MSEALPPLSGSQPGGRPARPNPLVAYLSRFDDGEVIRWAFRGLLLGAVGVLALDLRDLAREDGWFDAAPPLLPATAEPVLPPAVRDDGDGSETVDPRDKVTADEDALRRPIRFSLQPGGVLEATGTIDPGAAARFAEEIAQRGEYVETVSLNSPGGSLADALAMSELVREKGLATLVDEGAICASSCPLLLAGGKARRVAEKAAVGLHQFYADNLDGLDIPQAMADAQATTAQITRHLSEMGVDPALWLHALETPPRRLYYLSAEEMAGYGLVTGADAMARQDG